MSQTIATFLVRMIFTFALMASGSVHAADQMEIINAITHDLNTLKACDVDYECIVIHVCDNCCFDDSINIFKWPNYSQMVKGGLCTGLSGNCACLVPLNGWSAACKMGVCSLVPKKDQLTADQILYPLIVLALCSFGFSFVRGHEYYRRTKMRQEHRARDD